MVTVYTTQNCPACTATKSWLERRGIPYRLEWLKESMEAMELAQANGFTAAPIVVAGPLSWSGFRPDLIDKIE
jgi:glutaredoxin-like protein NrdH